MLSRESPESVNRTNQGAREAGEAGARTYYPPYQEPLAFLTE